MAIETWDKQVDDSRKDNQLATYIIFCEDEIHEPAYFQTFYIEEILRINPIPNQGQGNQNFLNLVDACIRDGSMQYTIAGYRINSRVQENIWSVYDRDMEEPDINPIKDHDFTNSINNANASGIKVAWSNDAFELWILLHFETVPTGTRLHRNYIYERLTEILKNLPGASETLTKITSHPKFHYKDHIKKRNNFVLNILPLLKDKTDTAIQNAAALEALYSHNIPYHDRNPCTMVHHLVQELLAYHTN